MLPDPEALADVVVQTIDLALGPVLLELAAVKERLAILGDLRDRVVAVEVKSALPLPVAPVVDLSPVLERVAATETRLADVARLEAMAGALQRDTTAMSDRVGTVETKAATPLAPDPILVELKDRVLVLETKSGIPPPVTSDPLVSELRDRIVAMETKAAQPVAPPPVVDLSPVLERVAVAETKLSDMTRIETLATSLQRDTAAIGERVAVLETRPQLPGPQGEPGQAGKDGADGKGGLPGLSFEGVFQEGKSYELGNLVTWAGSSWHCNEATMTKPGDGSKSWTLMVKRGQNGRDGRDAPGALPVVSVGVGR